MTSDAPDVVVETIPVARESAALLDDVSRGDAPALELLYDRYRGQCFGLALRLVGDDAGVAEDVVQEVFLRVWRSAGTYDPDRGRFDSWLFSLTRHLCIDAMRRRERQPALSSGAHLAEIAGRDDVWRDVMQGLTGATVRTALATLPHGQRHALELAYFDGLTCEEIARRTEAPLGTVKGRLRLGLRQLRRLLGGVEPAVTG